MGKHKNSVIRGLMYLFHTAHPNEIVHILFVLLYFEMFHFSVYVSMIK